MKLMAQCSGKHKTASICKWELSDDNITNVDEAGAFLDACQTHANEEDHLIRIIGDVAPSVKPAPAKRKR